MKKILSLLSILATLSGIAQNNPINFETNGYGGSWTWTVFENDSNPPLEIITNPDPSGINTSATVAKFTALQTGQPFAGVESMHGADIGTFSLSEDNAIVKIMVWKSVISDVGIKFATPEGASTGELKVANTLVNQWEELVFDFTEIIGLPSSNGIDQLIVFPDFTARAENTVIYFDNITFSDNVLGVKENLLPSIVAFPNPSKTTWTINATQVIQKITIHNLSGQLVIISIPQSLETNIHLDSLSPGIFFATIHTLSGEKTIKLIKI
ncbi:MAG: T9SS type A sorting domain-containing protein [Bacteroidetes bacterium]|nr:T9SS type A sorting domain-containing protein [Bacteroidota bacterium]